MNEKMESQANEVRSGGGDPGGPTAEAPPRYVEQPLSPPQGYGSRLPPRTPPRKSGLVAGLLSMFPGLGQVYVGYYKLGFIHAGIFVALIGILNSGGGPEGEPIFGTSLAFLWLYSLVDAVRRASLYNQILDGVVQADLPQDQLLPGPGGSLVGGACLILAGVIFFLHTMFGMSLDWVADWWPMAVIGFGVYLVVKSDAFQKWWDQRSGLQS